MRTIRFQKERLPPPRAFYEGELGSLSRPNRQGWASARCPFHHSKSKRSFWVNLNSGGFNCFGCGVHGGDVIDFVCQRDSLSFKVAAQLLGAWAEMPSPEVAQKVLAQARERDRHRVSEEERHAEQRRARMVLRQQIHTAARIQREASERLDEIRSGAVPATADEENLCWDLMALAFNYERQCEIEYMTATGLEYLG